METDPRYGAIFLTCTASGAMFLPTMSPSCNVSRCTNAIATRKQAWSTRNDLGNGLGIGSPRFDLLRQRAAWTRFQRIRRSKSSEHISYQQHCHHCSLAGEVSWARSCFGVCQSRGEQQINQNCYQVFLDGMHLSRKSLTFWYAFPSGIPAAARASLTLLRQSVRH